MGVFEAADEELAGEGDVDGHIAMHGVLAQHVNAEFFASLRETPQSVQCQDIGEDASALVVVNEFQSMLPLLLPLDE